jgi:DNA-binding transcriptional MerR regulator
MSHKIAKLILEHASTFLERTEAIKTAHSLGMPLHEIHEYLDWLEVTSPRPNSRQGGQSRSPSQERSPEKLQDK